MTQQAKPVDEQVKDAVAALEPFLDLPPRLARVGLASQKPRAEKQIYRLKEASGRSSKIGELKKAGHLLHVLRNERRAHEKLALKREADENEPIPVVIPAAPDDEGGLS